MKFILALCLVGLVMAAEAVPEAVSQQLPHRKLAQRGQRNRYGGQGYGRRYPDPDAQFARNQAALINTQYAIRNAEESGADPRATRGATYAGSTNAYLAAQGSNLVFGPWGKK